MRPDQHYAHESKMKVFRDRDHWNWTCSSHNCVAPLWMSHGWARSHRQAMDSVESHARLWHSAHVPHDLP